MSISVCVAGDVVPLDRTTDLFMKRDGDYLFGELMPIIKECDISVVNLEAPVICGGFTPIAKVGPCLHATPETAETLREAGFGVVTLANNHFRDQGENGVRTTLDVCDDLGLLHVGGGRNAAEARRALRIVGVKGKSVAFVNACETEFSIASNGRGGGNPIDLINMSRDIPEAKRTADHVVVILHGGIEHYQYPTLRMKRLYRHIVDLGADAVVNCHQHCFSGYEVYAGKPIFYGIGNFCFDRENMRDCFWNQGYMVVLELGESVGYRIVPYTQCDHEPKLKLCAPDCYEKEIGKLNNAIGNDFLLDQMLTDFVMSNERNLLADFLPTDNRYVKALYRRGLLGKVFSKRQTLRHRNLLTCESHNDVMKHLFSILST